MNKIDWIMLVGIFVLGYVLYFSLPIVEDNIFGKGGHINSNKVNIKIFINSDCKECTKLNNYLKVYKKAGVKFGNISIKEYEGGEYKRHFNEYDIEKLPFIIFSKELSKYETIANSWDDTFGYKNEYNEFIVTDIIPPYFDIKTKKIKGLIDMTYIGDNSCSDCYKRNDVLNILSEFGLKFNVLKNIDKKSDNALNLINKYNITTLPTVILSSNTNLYKNFSFFWKNIGTIEEDGNYILRNPGKLNLFINK